MGKFKDLTGQKFGRLLATEYLGHGKWSCVCDCGNFTLVSSRDLNSGHTKSCGCSRKKYKIDEHYFDNIDTPEKAYILGMLSADGAITYHPYNVKLELKSNDEDILQKIKQAMNYDFNIKHYHNRLKSGEYNYICDTSRMNITNKTIVLKLAEYGIVPRKSNVLDFDFEKISQQYYSHYLRGLWDGDGTISINTHRKKPQPTLNITSSTIMIRKIIAILSEKFIFQPYLYNRRKNNLDNTTMIIGRKMDIQNTLSFLYKDADIYLNRKYEKYTEVMKLLSM